MMQRVFTPQEANRRLPLIKKIVTEILQKGKVLKTLIEQNQSSGIPVEGYNIQSEIEELMTELEDLGCSYKDWNFEVGLVDFPSVINGEDVLLCWRSDEEKIRFYHSHQEGYAGRQLIPHNLLN